MFLALAEQGIMDELSRKKKKSAEYDLSEYPTPLYALVLGVVFNMPTSKVLGRETGSW